jgi:hypothetical protein
VDKSQWQISDRFIVMLVIAFGIVFLAMQILPMFAGSRKLRGNQWALVECRSYLEAAGTTKTNNLNFDFSKLSDDDKFHAIFLGRNFDFWAETNFVWGNSSNREIVIVCQTQFDNVHKPDLWNSFWRNPAHAVGYSDGSTGLISSEQYATLNLNGFSSFTNLFAFIKK